MTRVFREDTRADVERAVLVGVSLPWDGPVARAHEHLDELAQLAETAGAQVVGRTVQSRTRLDGATCIGEGKARALREACERLGANLVIFDVDLSPAQARNVERIVGVNVVDRTELILDIFARHARTQQARIQVELAQLQYALPRLTRLWDHLSRQAGGIGLRGPGETQLEVDRRRIHQRMAALRRRLARVERRRETLRRSHGGRPVAALVGYTNAGKSTLMRRLTGADVVVRDRLFATLDTTTRRIRPDAVDDASRRHARRRGRGNGSGNGRAHDASDVLLVDTVGFIRKLPDHLVTSFRATLQDTAQADLYVHVIDASHPSRDEQAAVTDEALAAIDNPGVETLRVYNKIDRLDPATLAVLRERHPDAVFVSAHSGQGLAALVDRIGEHFARRSVRVEVRVSAGDGRAISRVRSLLRDAEDAFDEDVCVLTGRIASALMGRLEHVPGARIRYLF